VKMDVYSVERAKLDHKARRTILSEHRATQKSPKTNFIGVGVKAFLLIGSAVSVWIVSPLAFWVGLSTIAVMFAAAVSLCLYALKITPVRF